MITSPSSDAIKISYDGQAIYFRQNDSNDYYFARNSTSSFSERVFQNTATVRTRDFLTVWSFANQAVYRYDSTSQTYNSILSTDSSTNPMNATTQTVLLYQSGDDYAVFQISGLSSSAISFLATVNSDSFISRELTVRRVIGRVSGGTLSPIADESFEYVDGGSLTIGTSADLSRLVTLFTTTTFNATNGTTSNFSSNTVYIQSRTTDFAGGVSREIVFADEANLRTFLTNGPIQNIKLTVADRFLLVNTPTLQEAYRFRGVYAIYAGSMALPTAFANSNLGEAVVNVANDHLRVLLVSLFVSGSSLFNLAEYDYGLVPLGVEIDDTQANLLFTVAIPYSTLRQYFSPSYELLWAYSEMNIVSTNTTIVYYNLTAGNANVSASNTIPATGNWNVEAIEAACGAFSNLQDTTEFRLILIQNQNFAAPIVQNISTLMAPFSPTTSSVWAVSRDCTGFRMDRFVFKVDLTATIPISNPTIAGNAQWTAIDEYLNFVLLSNGTVLHYNTGTSAFENFVLLASVASNATLHSYNDRLVYLGVESTSVQLTVYERVNNAANLVLDQTFSSSTTPVVKLSAQKTKVFVFRTATVNGTTTNDNQAITISYTSPYSSNSVTLASHLTTLDPATHYVFLDETYLYTHTYPNASSQMEHLYWFKYADRIVRVYQEPVSNTEQTEWVKTLLVDSPGTASVTLIKEYNVSSSVELRRVEVSQAQEQQYYEAEGTSVAFLNGALTICPYGCSSCEEGSCEACLSGFVLDSSSAVCQSCPANCEACSLSDATTCTTCRAGTYLSAGACLVCTTPCLTCSAATTNCTACVPGYYLSSNQCIACATGCKSCSASGCSDCFPRYTLFNGNCLLCGPDCTGCASSNILECTSCAAQFFLNGTACSRCPSDCLTCSSASYCEVCENGYFSDASGVCREECKLPCATCNSNSSSQCASCFAGFTLTANGTCAFADSCSSNYSCYECGSLSNYYLSNVGQCLACPSSSNCLQCSESLPTQCAVCERGYFPFGGICTRCGGECAVCESFGVCLECSDGYTFAEGQTAGACTACHGSCSECYQQPGYCLECASSYTSNGWFCQSSKFVNISIVLNGQ